MLTTISSFTYISVIYVTQRGAFYVVFLQEHILLWHVPLLWRLLLQLHGFVFVKAFAGCDFAFAGCGCRLAFDGSGDCRLDWVNTITHDKKDMSKY